MILPLVALLLQTAPAPAVSRAEGKPVRVWLGAGTTLVRGDPVRVYVQAATAGSLVVLHRRTDGHIDVLFPARPTDDPSITAGTYEIRGPGDHESFVVAEPDGTGLILAALSTAPYRFDEFVREASWNPDALVPSWSGVDGEGALADVVQRMLGDDYFNYDLVAYTVAPPAYALQDTTVPYPTTPCGDCSFVGFELIFVEPFFLGAPRFRRVAPFGANDANAPTRVLGLAAGRTQRAAIPVAVAVRSPARHSSGSIRFTPIPAVQPRTRTPVTANVRAVPLGPGHQVVDNRPANRALSWRGSNPTSARFREVRLTLSPTAPPAEPESLPTEPRAVGLVALPPTAAPAPAEPGGRVTVARPRLPASVSAPSGVPLHRAVMGARTTSPMRAAALAEATGHALATHGAAPVVAAGRRR